MKFYLDSRQTFDHGIVSFDHGRLSTPHQTSPAHPTSPMQCFPPCQIIQTRSDRSLRMPPPPVGPGGDRETPYSTVHSLSLSQRGERTLYEGEQQSGALARRGLGWGCERARGAVCAISLITRQLRRATALQQQRPYAFSSCLPSIKPPAHTPSTGTSPVTSTVTSTRPYPLIALILCLYFQPIFPPPKPS